MGSEVLSRVVATPPELETDGENVSWAGVGLGSLGAGPGELVGPWGLDAVGVFGSVWGWRNLGLLAKGRMRLGKERRM